MEKQVFLESVIRMYGGIEFLAEELLNEIGDNSESDTTKFLKKLVSNDNKYDEARRKSSPEIMRSKKIKAGQKNASQQDKIEYWNAYANKNYADGIEDEVKTARRDYKHDKDKTLINRIRSELDKHGNLPNKETEQNKKREEFGRDAAKYGKTNRYGK